MTPSLNSTGKSISSANKIGALALKAICLAAMVAGVAWNTRLGIADFLARRNQPGDTRLAMRWMPANAAFAAQLADEVYANDPAMAKLLLEQAVHLNRYDAASWIQLGLLHEAGNDFSQAQTALLQAAAADSTFLPAWSLANFYFRHENAARFWYWARRAARMAPDDATALLRLAWYVSPDVAEVEARLQIQKPAIEGQLVNFLITRGDPPAVTAAALHLLGSSQQESVETLLGACDWLLAGKHSELALSIWNRLAERRQIPYAPLTPGLENPVTNGKFEQSPMGRGFDWRLATVEGVSSYLNVQPGALGFELSGSEPDSFLLLRQAAPVSAKPYALVVDYETAGIAPGSGLVWTVSDGQSGAMLAMTPSLSAEHGGKALACFRVSKGAQFVDLSLSYQRQPGTVRAEGKVALKQVRLADPGSGVCG